MSEVKVPEENKIFADKLWSLLWEKRNTIPKTDEMKEINDRVRELFKTRPDFELQKINRFSIVYGWPEKSITIGPIGYQKPKRKV